MSTFTGVFPVFQTPFYEDESIDYETLESEIAWLLDRGADGIVMAMVSETLRLASDERDELASRVCAMTGARGPVIISVGAESRHTAIRYARLAEAHGAAAVMAIPPIATALDEAVLPCSPSRPPSQSLPAETV
jgi:2-keto-3-deoxy-L-arabinonate dehydratase